MKKLINGQYVEITAEELAEMQPEAEKHTDEIPPVPEISAEEILNTLWKAYQDEIKAKGGGGVV